MVSGQEKQGMEGGWKGNSALIGFQLMAPFDQLSGGRSGEEKAEARVCESETEGAVWRIQNDDDVEGSVMRRNRGQERRNLSGRET